MKRKLFLFVLLASVLTCVFTICISAKNVSTGYFDSNGNEIVVPTYDEEGDALLWMRRDKSKGAPTTQAIIYYECTDEDGTEYYLFNRKAKDSISVNSNYSFSFKLNIGITTSNIVIMNLDGIAHSNGTEVQRFAFTMQNNTSLQYVYFPASFTSTKNINDNKQVFLGNSALEMVEFAPGSQITELGPSAFKTCAITEIVLPEGLTYIDERAFDGCSSLKKIYIPKSVTFVDEIAFRGVTDAEYYFTGTEETASGWEITDEIKYVNHCDVYYGGKHIYTDDGDCTTALLCEKCLFVIEAAAQSHDNQLVLEYANGFMNNGIKRDGCTNCSAYTEEKLDPLFISLGYSAAEYGDMMSVNYRVNESAIKEYEEITGKTVNYGVFAVRADKIGDKELFDENGVAQSDVIAADITDCGFTLFNLKIVGFTSEQKDTDLAMGAFVGTTKDDTIEYSYLQIGEPTNGKYFFASYNDVLALLPKEPEVA